MAPPAVLFHGTSTTALASIREAGEFLPHTFAHVDRDAVGQYAAYEALFDGSAPVILEVDASAFTQTPAYRPRERTNGGEPSPASILAEHQITGKWALWLPGARKLPQVRAMVIRTRAAARRTDGLPERPRRMGDR